MASDSHATKAAIAARFGDAAIPNGGNGKASAAKEEAAPPPPAEDQQEDVGGGAGTVRMPPAISNMLTQEETPNGLFTRAKKPPPGNPTDRAQLNRILPTGHRVHIYKRIDNGQQMFIGEFGPNEIASAGGDVIVFVRKHLSRWLDQQVNYFAFSSVDPGGKTTYHGEHPIAGEAPMTNNNPGPTMIAQMPPADPLADMARLEELRAKQYQQWREQQEEQRRDRDVVAEASKKAAEGGNIMAAILPMLLRDRTPATPPPDPVRDAELLEARIQRHVAPLADTMSRGLNGLAEQITRMAEATPRTPPPPAVDPMIAVTRLLEVMKPTTPAGPSAAEIQMMIRDAVSASLPKKDDGFSLKDWITMKSEEDRRREEALREARREAREERDRMEAQMERRLAEMKVDRPRDPLETVEATISRAKSIVGLVAPGESGGIADRIFDMATTPDFWGGLSDFWSTVKGAQTAPTEEETAEEENPEEQPIEVSERPQEVVQQAAPVVVRQPVKPAVKPKGRPPVTPADLAVNDYPEGFDAEVAPVAQLADRESTTPQEAQAQIIALLGSLWWCMNHSQSWNRRVRTGLIKLLAGGPKMVPHWVGAYIRGLNANGRLTKPQADTLEKVVTENADAIVAFVKSKVKSANKK